MTEHFTAHQRPIRHTARRALVVTLTAAVTAMLMGSIPAAAAPTAAGRPKTPVPATKLGTSTAHRRVAAPKPDPALAAADAATRRVEAAGVHYPNAGTATVTVPVTGDLVQAGNLPVRIGVGTVTAGRRTASGAAAASAGGRAVRVTVASHTATTAAGIDGTIVTLTSPTTAATGPSLTHLVVDYSGFAAGGGDYAARLTLVDLPACALSTPTVAACQRRTPIKFSNDLATHTLTGDVTVPAAPTPARQAAGATGTAAAPAPAIVVAATAAPSSGGGDYTATSLSASATWQAGGSSGDFNWSYPLRVPPANGGPSPDLAISYDSQSLDGRLPANNNQPSWIGDGFDLPTSYIERDYDSCNDEGVTTSYDECWKYNNATLVLNGQATQLVQDSSGMWRPKDDDGSRIVDSTTSTPKNGDNDGETWTVTTTDGTQYVFGMNELPGWVSTDAVTNSVWTVPVYGNDTTEPCHGSTFATSSCMQAWRWNLDYVVDPNGNTETFWYTPEYNYYAQDGNTGVNGTQYTRGGYLARIDYGQTASNIYTSTPPEQVLFKTDERCITTGSETCTSLTSADQADWPDVPFDEICASGTHCTAGQVAPTFFSTRRLTNITTQYWTGTGTTYQKVDSWDLGQSFPATGDGTPAALFLNSITHTGQVGGTLAENAVTFGPIQETNRVDLSNPNIDPLIRWRVHTITSETGSVITIGYMPPQCTSGQTMPSPDANTLRCFPQYWTPPGAKDPQLDWFQKYPVNQVLQSDPTGGSVTVETDYTYTDPAWHYDDTTGIGKTKNKTWSVWRGYQHVTATTGAPGDTQTKTTTQYYQGMDGDKLAAGGTKTVKITDSQGTQVTDSAPLAGHTRESISYNGISGAEISGTIHDEFIYQSASQTESWGTVVADIVADAATHTRTDLAAGGVRTQTITTTYDTSHTPTTPATGLPLTVDDTGNTAITGDEECTRTTYAQNSTLWLMDYPDRTETVAVACAATPNRPTDVISDTRTEYDNGAFAAAPTKGNPTQTERLLSYTGTTANYQMVSQTSYDSQGRPLVVTDARNFATTTTYTPATGGPLTGTTVSNALNQVTTTTASPAWGSTTSEVDANNKRTDEAYDPLGRLVSVWEPTRTKAINQNPNIKYVYTLSNTAPSTVVTQSVNNDGTTYLTTSITLYDAMLRSRQIQTPAPQGGRVISQTDYNSLGQAVNVDADYTDASAPSTTMANITSTWPKRTATTYDGAGRATASTLYADGGLNNTTTTTYGGDRTTVTPPTGGVATTAIADIRGNVTERDDYNASTPTGSFVATKYTYTPSNQLATVTDAAGNTWQYTYDLAGRLVKTVDPDLGTSTADYDADDNIADTTDAAGTILVFTYDALDRKTAEYTGSVAPANEQAAWTYDTIAKGQLTASTRYVGGATGHAYSNAITSYDSMYRATGTSVTIPTNEATGIAGTYTTAAAYNLDGTLQLQSIPAGGGLPLEALTYTYNTTRQVTKIQGSTGILQAALYTKLGQLQQTTLGVSSTAKLVQITNAYDDGTERLHNTLVTDDTHPTPDVNATYFYDRAGNTTEVNDQGGGTDDNQCFTYGPQDRLQQAWTTTSTCGAGPSTTLLGGPAPYWLSWSYDGNTGLRTQQINHASGGNTETDYTYPAAGGARPHALQTTTSTIGGATTGSYSYNNDGQTTSRPGPGGQQTLTWDAEDHLSTITQGGNTTSNIYDANGNLLISHGPTQTILYVDGEQITRTTSGSLTCEREIDLGAIEVALRTNAGLTWLVNDPHNTTTLAIDATTQAASHLYETPFNTVRGTPPVGWVDNNGFLDKPNDSTIGLTYLGAREYDPNIGRFISVDPDEKSDDPQSLSAYVYSANNPILESDPTGLRAACGIDIDGSGVCGSELKSKNKKASRAARDRIIDYENAQARIESSSRLYRAIYLAKLRNRSSVRRQASAAAGAASIHVWFGQRRVGPEFSAPVEGYIDVRELADAIGNGTVDPDAIRIDAFLTDDGRYVAIGTRRLYVLTRAGKLPTNVNVIESTNAQRDRLNEQSVLGDELPSTRAVITPSQQDLSYQLDDIVDSADLAARAELNPPVSSPPSFDESITPSGIAPDIAPGAGGGGGGGGAADLDHLL